MPNICPVNFRDAWAHLGSLKCLSLETHPSIEEAIEAFVSGSRLWCKDRASLIMHQRGKSIRDHIHLMHEADIYALKNTCLLSLNPWPGKVGLSSLRVAVARGLDGLGWGWRYPTLRHHFCPVPDKTLKHAWDVYSTMANSTYLTHPWARVSLSVVTLSGPFVKKTKRWVGKSLERVLQQTKIWHFCLFVVSLTFGNITD